jgi:hypothetical protein
MPHMARLALPSVWRGRELRCIPSAALSACAATSAGFHPQFTFANRDLLYGTMFSGLADAGC